ncbi:MAG: ABC transporter ATP-binding protein [Phreatobacter sp.]|uniref:ABC transporter ATP-binding protein n=1 Tax=Phreatobacter sp. TaxID=1966341 RepID=UPI0027361FF2|nr:ABC transporter ATP-binding protein [Phreatobacter sp.]MDP2803494.1 ABC transporter ATP-binding protein [Phreatobacter sp.]
MSGLVLERVSVSLGGRPVLQDVTLAVEPRALLAVVGPNGAGKTSLLRAVAGLAPFTGTMRLGGETLGGGTSPARARRIAYLPQRSELAWALSVRDAVMLGRLPHGDPFSGATPQDVRAVAAALDRLGLAGFAARPVTELSGGERARVMLARVLATEASLLLADEPTAALDPAHQLAVLGLLRQVAAEGRIVVAVLHDLALAARFADQVAVLHDGRLAAIGPPDAALSDGVLGAVFGLAFAHATVDGRRVPIPLGPR